jgi:uncharacterized protein HemX
MKNTSLWVLVLVLALVGSAVWYEVQYRHVNKTETSAPVRRASTKKADKPVDKNHIKPTDENGQMIG